MASPWRARLRSLLADSTIHWRAPAIMLVSLFFGILTSFAHHVFNTIINGHSAGGATEQQWIRRVETAFAFASKLFLATSTAVAYTQYLWFHLQRNTSRMASIDALFAVTSQSFRVIHFKLWRRRPMLAAIAFVTWTLPLAAIFTPGTLTVQSEVHTRSSQITVPERSYSDVSYYANTRNLIGSSNYTGMSVETTRNVGRVQLSNTQLSVPRQNTNVTYATSFNGPAISCSRMETVDVNLIGEALQGVLQSNFTYHGHGFSGSQIVYFGWVPQHVSNISEANTTFFEQYITQGDAASTSNLDYVSHDAARIYVYLNGSGLTQNTDGDGQFKRVPNALFTPDALITCKMYNASYQVDFDVRTNGEQTISASTTFLNWQSTQSHGSDNGSSSDAFSTQALMEAFGWTFTQFLYILPPSNGSTTIYGTHALEMNSALLPVQSDIDASESPRYMMHQLEDFFQNMTLGLRYADLPDHSDNSSMTSIDVTSRFFRADYVYESEALIIAYAISNVIALLCVMIGAYAIFQNGASFTNYFSTIVRVTNHLDLEESIDERDRTGSDPLPSHLANTVVGLGQQREQVKQELSKTSTSYSWHEGSRIEDPDWQSSTLRGMGLR